MIHTSVFGKVKQYWWGMRWILKHKKVKKVCKMYKKEYENRIETSKKMGIAGAAFVTFTIIGEPLKGASIAKEIIMKYLDLKRTVSILKKHDEGKGVIIDFPGTYSIRKVQCIKIIGNRYKISPR